MAGSFSFSGARELGTSDRRYGSVLEAAGFRSGGIAIGLAAARRAGWSNKRRPGADGACGRARCARRRAARRECVLGAVRAPGRLGPEAECLSCRPRSRRASAWRSEHGFAASRVAAGDYAAGERAVLVSNLPHHGNQATVREGCTGENGLHLRRFLGSASLRSTAAVCGRWRRDWVTAGGRLPNRGLAGTREAHTRRWRAVWPTPAPDPGPTSSAAPRRCRMAACGSPADVALLLCMEAAQSPGRHPSLSSPQPRGTSLAPADTNPACITPTNAGSGSFKGSSNSRRPLASDDIGRSSLMSSACPLPTSAQQPPTRPRRPAAPALTGPDQVLKPRSRYSGRGPRPHRRRRPPGRPVLGDRPVGADRLAPTADARARCRSRAA